MQQITTSWLAFLALGAGVILLALAPGLGIPVAAAPVGLGLFEFGWGAAVLYSNRLVLPRTMRAVALVAPVGWTVILLVALVNGSRGLEFSLGFYPMAVVTVFNLILVAAVSRALHQPAAAEGGAAEGKVRTARTVAPLLYLAALMVGGVAVSMVTTPALAATQAGVVNVHSNHGQNSGPEGDVPEDDVPEDDAAEDDAAEDDAAEFTVPEHAGH